MRILFLNNYYYMRGGSERVMFGEQGVLREAGHEVEGFSQRHSDNFTAKYADIFPEYFDCACAAGWSKARVAFRLIRNVEAAKRLAYVLEDFRPDIVHAHNIYGGLTTSVLDAARKRRIPVVLTLHDMKLICPSYLMLNRGVICEKCIGGRFYNCLIQKCHKKSRSASAVYTFESYYNKWFGKWEGVSRYISPSIFLRDKMIESGIAEQKVRYLPNFIDTRQCKPSAWAGGYVLYAGRLSREKGILTLLRAFQSTGIQLQVAGDGPMREKAERFIREHSMDNAALLGHQRGEALAQLFRNAAFVVIPSDGYENAPMSILEAFAHGKPVLGSDLGGIPELVISGKTGYVFRRGSVEELRNGVAAMWENKDKLASMGAAARKRIEEEFNAEMHCRELLEIYESVLGANARS